VGQPFVSPELAFRLLANANGTAGMPSRKVELWLDRRNKAIAPSFFWVDATKLSNPRSGEECAISRS
jgi:hypothetical protein